MAFKGFCLLLFGFLLLVVLLADYSCAETDTLLQGPQLSIGQHLESVSGTFSLGFQDRYLSVWYTNKPHVGVDYDVRLRKFGSYYKEPVWVANQGNPVQNGLLLVGEDGNLKIFSSEEDPIALTSAQVSVGCKTSASLLDDGNFVLRELNKDGSIRRLLWQSFEHPTDTFLPGMKIGINLQTGHRWVATSGLFTFGMDPKRTKQLVVWWDGEEYWRSGVWIDGHFNMSNKLRSSRFHFRYYSNENEKYFAFKAFSSFPALTIKYNGLLTLAGEALVSCTEEDTYRNLQYTSNRPGCLPVPSCRIKNPEQIGIYGNLKGVYEFYRNASIRPIDCYMFCLRNCSCVAYDIIRKNGDLIGCQIANAAALRLYFGDISGKRPLGVFVSIGAVLIFITCVGLRIYKHPDVTHQIRMQLTASTAGITMKWREFRERVPQIFFSMMITNTEQEILLNELGIDEMHNHGHSRNRNQELQFFSLETVTVATDNFASHNKLGEGGFGPVYKGKLPGGLEVAIKRLATNSRQGMVELKNEVKVIAKLQHNNLVRLVGCCLEKGEKILIYEYMSNKSLDFFLFDEANRRELSWGRRFKIIEGIAQGLLYLHKYSRLKIIHRDLKAGNILLDGEMNPKISDFGMAKIFRAEESKANTNRVVGTYGYMPPEYAIEGIFSTKSDVFSFGVLLLEIVSGRRNNSFHHSDGPLSLIVYAWEIWTLDRVVELIDPTIEERHHKEVIRCIHIGLLCVQEKPMDRPNMLDVASMLYNEATELRSPNQPAFYNRNNLQGSNLVGYSPRNLSENEVTITDLEGR